MYWIQHNQRAAPPEESRRSVASARRFVRAAGFRHALCDKRPAPAQAQRALPLRSALPLAVWSRTGRWRGSRLCSADGLRRALLDAFRIDTRTITRHDMQGDNEN